MNSHRQQCLADMGIPVYVRRRIETDSDTHAKARTEPVGDGISDADCDVTSRGNTRPTSAPVGDEIGDTGCDAGMQGRRETADGSVGNERPFHSPDRETGDAPTETSGSSIALWRELQNEVSACTRCELHRGRTQTVFGVGRLDADLMIVGEAPGAEEDRRGEPFVGRGGELLNAMLLAIGLSRDEVYIANVLKCRPPKNRDPLPAEIASCTGYLRRQIDLVHPKAILAVGRFAAQWLLQTDISIGRLRGRLHQFGNGGEIPLIVTYHPAYLLRTPSAKAKAWQDLCLVRQALSAEAAGTSI